MRPVVVLVPIALALVAGARLALRTTPEGATSVAATPTAEAMPVQERSEPTPPRAPLAAVEAGRQAEPGAPRPAYESRTLVAREVALQRATQAMERATLRPRPETVGAAPPTASRTASFELEGTHLVVRLQGPDGEPWDGAAPRIASDKVLAGLGRMTVVSSADAPIVRVVPCSPRGEPPAARGTTLVGGHLEGGATDFAVEAGARYLVSVLHPAFSPLPQLAEVPSEGGRCELTARATEVRESASLDVHLRLPAGARGDRSLFVRLEDPETGALVDQARWSSDHPFDFALTAPPGRYRLVALGRPWHESHHGTLVREREVGRAELELDLRPGERRDIELEVGRGAFLDLVVDGLPDEGDRAVVRQRWGAPHDASSQEREDRFASRATVELRGSGGRREEVGLERESGWFRSSTAVSNAWPLGLRETSEVVSPGTWTLIARLPGGREVAREVELRAGEITRVRLAFED